MKKKIFIVFIVLTGFLLMVGGCAKPEEREPELIELESQLSKDPRNIEIALELLTKYFYYNEVDNVIVLFEEYSADFKDNSTARVYYGSSMAKKAGFSEKIEDKLLWLKKGMIALDEVVSDYPDEPLGYIWRGVTYSHLPVMLNMGETAKQDLNLSIEKYESGEWEISQNDLGIVYLGFLTIGLNNDDFEYIEAAYENLKIHVTNTNIWIYDNYEEALKDIE